MKVIQKTPKYIITDIDGVILKWEYAFLDYIDEKGIFERTFSDVLDFISETDIDTFFQYAYEFNNEDVFKELEPFEDAKRNIENLKNEGYKFIGISSAGKSRYIWKKRWYNINKHFPDAFITIHHCDLGENKIDFLKNYTESHCWIEDSLKNAEKGYKLGMKSIYIDRYDSDLVPEFSYKVSTWDCIYKHIKELT